MMGAKPPSASASALIDWKISTTRLIALVKHSSFGKLPDKNALRMVRAITAPVLLARMSCDLVGRLGMDVVQHDWFSFAAN